MIPPNRINSRDELINFAVTHGLRIDWHEPDEENITASVDGTSFDNCGAWPLALVPAVRREAVEMYVTLRKLDTVDGRAVKGAPLAYVNLATLFAWATGYQCPQPDGDRVTMSEARHKIKREVYALADQIIRTTENKSLGVAMSQIVREIGDKIGK